MVAIIYPLKAMEKNPEIKYAFIVAPPYIHSNLNISILRLYSNLRKSLHY